ncbi:hypothetical protein [Flavonifractor sp. An306]|uniref:hypothetical protein n=1 Tax=Flavonifractor sp. An306 TaxID=1965629 RepID=UPI00174A1645|nr:hypothetical protein [Flavonifractor sp. An306]
MYSNDYFSQKMGFVIDDTHFETKEAAYAYLHDTCYMEAADCEAFLRRMIRDYLVRVRAAMRKEAF